MIAGRRGRRLARRLGRQLGRRLTVWFGVVLLASSLAAAGSAAPAQRMTDERSRVAVIRLSDSDPVMTEALTRLSAELGASGFDVVIVDGSRDADPRALVESAKLVPPPIATFVLTRVGGGASAEVWVADQLTGKTAIRRVDVRASAEHDAPSILAIRAVELLRASLLEAAVEPTGSAPSPSSQGATPSAPLPSDVSRWMGPVAPKGRGPSDTTRGFALGLGGAVLHSFAGVGPELGGYGRLGVRLGPTFGMRLTLVIAPLTLTPTAERAEGSVAVRQYLLELEGTAQFPIATRIAAIGSIGGGVYDLQATGHPADQSDPRAPVYSGSDGSKVAIAIDAGGGLTFALGENSALVAELHALVTQPSPIITFAGKDVGQTGRPSLLGALGVQARF